MKKFNLKIGDKEYLIKLSFRSLMTYERLSGNKYTEIKTLENLLVYMYACIISSNDVDVDWDGFIDMIDNDQLAFREFLKHIYEPPKEESGN